MADVADNPGGGGGDDRNPRRGDPSRGGCGGDTWSIKIPFYSDSESETDDESVRTEKIRAAEKFRDEMKSTLDGLASAVNEHTGEIVDLDARFASIENRQGNIENRQGNMENRQDNIENRQDNAENHLWFHAVIVWAIVAVLVHYHFFGGSA